MWRRGLKEKWARLRFGEVTVRTDAEQHVFEAEVDLDGLDPDAVRVELCADGIDGKGKTRQEMDRVEPPANGANGAVYRAKVPATRAASDYTPRIIPHRAGVSVPLEFDAILWQR
jgi:starch phosphorylase